jgi:ribosomal-protein-alanine N-acetyltransferase
MEKMPFQPELERATVMATASTVTSTPATTVVSDWRAGLPVMAGSRFTLRELRASDAASLLAMLTTEEVSRFISPPPTTVDGFEKFIAWTHRERQAGSYVCFAIVPHGMVTAVGLFQVRSIEAGFANAEWGFCMGSDFWGTGIFAEGAQMVLQFAFDTIGCTRLEARACVANGRQRRAPARSAPCRKACCRSFLRNGQYLDQALVNSGGRLALRASAPQRRSTKQISPVQSHLRPGHFQGVRASFYALVRSA